MATQPAGLPEAPAAVDAPIEQAKRAPQQTAYDEPVSDIAGIHAENASTPVTLSYPYGIGVDAAGNIYVTNLFGGVNVYSPASLLKTASIKAGFAYPASVAFNSEGNLYVANFGANNVTIYNSSHAQIGTITDSTLQSPTSLYIDGDDDIWVLDATGTLHLYLYDGTPAGSTQTGGTAVGPWLTDVTVWGITDPNGGYDEAYENAGLALHVGPNLSNTFEMGSPYAGGETQDSTGKQYVTDVFHNQIQIWAANGAYRTGTIDTPAPPYGIAVDSSRKRIYVTMTTVNEVNVYSMVPPYNLAGTIK